MAPLPLPVPPALSYVHCPSLQCDYKTTDREELENHVSAVHEGKKFPSGLKNAARPDISKVRKSVFTCHVCNSSYTSMKSLNSHFTSVHGIGRKKPLPCSICHNFFADRFALMDHKLSHIGNLGNNALDFKNSLKIENDETEYDEGVDPLAMWIMKKKEIAFNFLSFSIKWHRRSWKKKVRISVITCDDLEFKLQFNAMVRLNSHFTNVHGIGRKKATTIIYLSWSFFINGSQTWKSRK